MKLFRNLIAIAAAAALSFAASMPAFAQAGPGSTTIFFPGQYAVYSATKVALAPAASATDFFTISGASGRVVRVLGIHCDGISTANAAALIQVVKRSTANSGGTSAAVAAVSNNSVLRAPLASVKSYTVNPASLGTAVGTPVITAQLVTGPAATSTLVNTGIDINFNTQWVVLNSAAETLALNANAASFTAGASINCTVKWTE